MSDKIKLPGVYIDRDAIRVPKQTVPINNTPTLTLDERVAKLRQQHKAFSNMELYAAWGLIDKLQSALKQKDDVLDKTKNVLKPFYPGTIHRWNPDGNNKGNIEISYDTYHALCNLYNTIENALKE